MLNQYMPDNTPTHGRHWDDAVHEVAPESGAKGHVAAVLSRPEDAREGVTSHHRQAISEAGSLAVAARAPDGVIEAIEEPDRRFYVGVQWHPERTRHEALGVEVFRRLVRSAGG
jgi:putative glutamine amidotransferase